MQKILEKPKLKHNKKRNTAFLYEALVKELTKAVLYGDKEKQKIISNLIKEHFNKKSALGKELIIYKQIYETKNFPKDSAQMLLFEVKNEYERFFKSKIFEEQSKLIAKINKMLGVDVYNNFVPNYKTLATLSQIFNKNVEPKVKVLLEQELIEHIVSTDVKENKKETVNKIDSLTFKRFIERFNETYNEALILEQKELLSKYINYGEESLEFKIYLSEEIGRLKKEIKNLKSNDSIKENEEILSKINKIDESLQKLKFEMVNEELIKKVMLLQELIKEVNS